MTAPCHAGRELPLTDLKRERGNKLMNLDCFRPLGFQAKIRPVRAALLLSLTGVTFILLASSLKSPIVAAQQPHQWFPNQRVQGYADYTFTPFLVADQNRTVHAFTSEWVGDRDSQLTVMYRTWSLKGGWTELADIILLPTKQAQFKAAFLDQAGMMHVAFAGGDDKQAGMYYSRAPAANARLAPAWSAPKLVADSILFSGYAALTGDNQGNLVILYGGNDEGNGVYAVQSSDAGNSWSDPSPVFLTYDLELTPYKIEVYLDPSGKVHATWNVVTTTGLDMSVYYARLDLESGQWSEPVLLEKRMFEDEGSFGPSFPSISGSGDSVVVMYNNGNPIDGGPVGLGRPVQRSRLSEDGGQTWKDAITPFPHHVGRSGEHSLTADSEGIVHALFIQRIESLDGSEYSSIGGIWHSELRDGRWGEPDRFITTYPPHDAHAVISQGNVLLVTWREDPGSGQHGIWYSYTTLDAPELSVVPLPTPPATPTATPAPTATPSAPTPTPWRRPVQLRGDEAPEAAITSPAIPFVLGVVPAVLLLVGTIVVHQLHHSRRQR
jgi:hypothetical protein